MADKPPEPHRFAAMDQSDPEEDIAGLLQHVYGDAALDREHTLHRAVGHVEHRGYRAYDALRQLVLTGTPGGSLSYRRRPTGATPQATSPAVEVTQITQAPQTIAAAPVVCGEGVEFTDPERTKTHISSPKRGW